MQFERSTSLNHLVDQIYSVEAMYRVCGLQLGPNFVVRLATSKNFYLRLTVEKMHVLAVLTINIHGHTAVATKSYGYDLLYKSKNLNTK